MTRCAYPWDAFVVSRERNLLPNAPEGTMTKAVERRIRVWIAQQENDRSLAQRRQERAQEDAS